MKIQFKANHRLVESFRTEVGFVRITYFGNIKLEIYNAISHFSVQALLLKVFDKEIILLVSWNTKAK